MLAPSQKICPVRPEHRQKVTVQAHNLCFILYSSAGISLVYQLTICDNRIGQLQGSLVQNHDINSILTQIRRHRYSQIAANRVFVTTVINQHSDICVAEGTSIPLYLGSEKVGQADTGMPSNHRADSFSYAGRFASSILDFPSCHFTLRMMKYISICSG
jgi:hypothetical protein